MTTRREGGVVKYGAAPAAGPQHVLPLFRDEALHFAGRSALGEGRSRVPLPATLIGTFFTLAACALIVFLCLAPYTNRMRVGGVVRLSAGVVPATLAQSGEITSVNVREGQHVTQGAPLFDVADIRVMSGGADVDRTLLTVLMNRRQGIGEQLSAERRAAADKRRLLELQIRNVGSQIRLLDAEIRAQRERLVIAERIVKRYQGLSKDGLVPVNDVENRVDQATAQRQALDVLLRRRLELLDSQQQTRMEIVAASRAEDVAQSESVQANSQVDQQSTQIRSRARFIVPAPVSGTVTAIAAFPGARPAVGARLLSIVPDGARLQAVLTPAGEVGGMVKVGQPVVMRIDAFPFQRFGTERGRIASVSRSSVGANGSASASGQHFELIVNLPRRALEANGISYPVKPGMTVTADVLLERRRLIEWLFDPASALSRSVRS